MLSQLKHCQNCGKFISPWKHEIEKGEGKFCSRECFYQSERKHWPAADVLRKLYLEEQKSAYQIGKLLSISRDAVFKALKAYDIPRRSVQEATRLAFDQGRVDLTHAAKREKSGNWKGGRVKRGGGYIALLLPQHHRANKEGYVLEHVVVWEEHNQRLLPDGWVIHHLNGIKDDNRPENLVGLPNKRHVNVLKAKAYRIQQLEAEVRKLRKVIEEKQLVFIPS